MNEMILRTHASDILQMCDFPITSMVIKMGSDQQVGRLKVEPGGRSICHNRWQGHNTQKW